MDAIIRKASSGPAKKNWTNAELLIIDEVSMMSAHLFEMIDTVGRAVTEVLLSRSQCLAPMRSSHKPFGGVQVVLSGDFFQLPPVARKGECAKAFQYMCTHVLVVLF
eukprot:Platyproteum_vivax@DN15566_c0_g1_i1.p2